MATRITPEFLDIPGGHRRRDLVYDVGSTRTNRTSFGDTIVPMRAVVQTCPTSRWQQDRHRGGANTTSSDTLQTEIQQLPIRFLSLYRICRNDRRHLECRRPPAIPRARQDPTPRCDHRDEILCAGGAETSLADQIQGVLTHQTQNTTTCMTLQSLRYPRLFANRATAEIGRGTRESQIQVSFSQGTTRPPSPQGHRLPLPRRASIDPPALGGLLPFNRSRPKLNVCHWSTEACRS